MSSALISLPYFKKSKKPKMANLTKEQEQSVHEGIKQCAKLWSINNFDDSKTIRQLILVTDCERAIATKMLNSTKAFVQALIDRYV